MAACGSLQHIFENPLPENPSLLDSLSSWNQIKPVNNKPTIDQSSFTEIFGELHFKESTSLFSSSSSASSSVIDLDSKPKKTSLFENSFSSSSSKYTSSHKKSDSFSLKSFESLQLCTEGLGFESSGEVDDLMLKNNNNSIKEEEDDDDDDDDGDHHNKDEGQNPAEKELSVVGNNSTNFCSEIVRRSRRMAAMTTTTTAATGGGGGGRFPPPISCLSKSNGKPWVCFKSYRQDGRFVLKEVRVQTQEFLHARREDGRLKLHFVQPNNEIVEDEDDENDEEDEEEEDDDDEEQESGENVADEDSENVRSELGHITKE